MSAAQETYSLGYGQTSIKFMVHRSVASHAAFFTPHLRPGTRLLDCGCGPGSITLGLARLVAPGEVVGVDREESQLDLARRAARAQNLTNVQFRNADVYALPFADHEFDALFSNALLEHLAQPVAALTEMRRVLKPGSIAGVSTPDWRGFLVEPSTPELEAAIAFYERIQFENGGDPYVGGKLGALMIAAGYQDVQLSAAYECYAPLSIIADLVIWRLSAAPELDQCFEKGWVTPAELTRHVDAVKTWQRQPAAMWAQAWVAALGRA